MRFYFIAILNAFYEKTLQPPPSELLLGSRLGIFTGVEPERAYAADRLQDSVYRWAAGQSGTASGRAYPLIGLGGAKMYIDHTRNYGHL